MAKLLLQKATTSKTTLIFVPNSSVTTGAGLTGLVYNSAGLTAYYYREEQGTGATSITLATATLGTWASGGFKEVDAANMPGWYEFGIPDAALATGADFVGIALKGATNMAPVNIEIQLTGIDVNDAVRGGMTALPTASPGQANGLFIAGTNAPVTISGSGNALTLTSTGGGGHGLQMTGEGLGVGFKATGGGTGGSGGSIFSGAGGATALNIIGGTSGLNVTGTSNVFTAATAAAIESEVTDALTTRDAATLTEISSLPVQPTRPEASMALYMALRNFVEVSRTGGTFKIHNNAATVIHTKTVADDGDIYTETPV